MTEPARREIYAATVFHSMRPGIFDHAEIEPAFALNESVKAIHSTLSAGDEVLPEHEGTLCQRASRTLLSASSREQLDKLIQQALTSIRILDPQERDLTLR